MSRCALCRKALWLLPALLGAVFYALVPGCRFTGLCLFGLSALLGLYRLLARLRRHRPRLALWLRRALSAAVAGCLLAAAVTLGFLFAASRGSDAAGCDYVVVLGAGVNGTAPSLSLSERLQAAQAYLAAHPDAICIVSGGQGSGESITEAECMYRWLTARGIPAERIWREPEAANTRENLRFSLDLIESRTGIRPDTIAVVSSEYHLLRAGLIARSEGAAAHGVPARTALPFLRANYYLREIAGIWAFYVIGN